MLVRVLPNLPENALVGIVLPIKFLKGTQFKQSRTILAQRFQILELLLLPDTIFEKSESETVLLMARKSQLLAESRSYFINYRSISERDINAFKLNRELTRDQPLPAKTVLGDTSNAAPTFWVPSLCSVWNALDRNIRVTDIAYIHRGVEFASGLLSNHRDAIVTNEEFGDSMRGVDRIDDQLLPFQLRNARWLSAAHAHRRLQMAKAWDLPWSEPKVLMNALRQSRGPWRVIAAYDRDGLLATQSFQSAWLKEGALALFLTAFFNSAVTNAYIFDHEFGRPNRVKTLDSIPLPSLTTYLIATVQEIAEECERRTAEDPNSDLTSLMMSLDAELLKGYDLAPREEKQLLDLFSGTQRPGCPSFCGFYPKGFVPAVPLHEHLSSEYNAARGSLFLSRLKVVDDAEISARLHEIRGQSDDDD